MANEASKSVKSRVKSYRVWQTIYDSNTLQEKGHPFGSGCIEKETDKIGQRYTIKLEESK